MNDDKLRQLLDDEAHDELVSAQSGTLIQQKQFDAALSVILEIRQISERAFALTNLLQVSNQHHVERSTFTKILDAILATVNALPCESDQADLLRSAALIVRQNGDQSQAIKLLMDSVERASVGETVNSAQDATESAKTLYGIVADLISMDELAVARHIASSIRNPYYRNQATTLCSKNSL